MICDIAKNNALVSKLEQFSKLLRSYVDADKASKYEAQLIEQAVAEALLSAPDSELKNIGNLAELLVHTKDEDKIEKISDFVQAHPVVQQSYLRYMENDFEKLVDTYLACFATK